MFFLQTFHVKSGWWAKCFVKCDISWGPAREVQRKYRISCAVKIQWGAPSHWEGTSHLQMLNTTLTLSLSPHSLATISFLSFLDIFGTILCSFSHKSETHIPFEHIWIWPCLEVYCPPHWIQMYPGTQISQNSTVCLNAWFFLARK